MQQRTGRVMKEPRSHINLDSQCRFDAISKNGLSNSKERTKRFCGGIHEAQKDCTDMEEKDGVQNGEKFIPSSQ